MLWIYHVGIAIFVYISTVWFVTDSWYFFERKQRHNGIWFTACLFSTTILSITHDLTLVLGVSLVFPLGYAVSNLVFGASPDLVVRIAQSAWACVCAAGAYAVVYGLKMSQGLFSTMHAIVLSVLLFAAIVPALHALLPIFHIDDEFIEAVAEAEREDDDDDAVMAVPPKPRPASGELTSVSLRRPKPVASEDDQTRS
jgi:hypothetical protein